MKHFLINFLRMGSTVSIPPIRLKMRSILLVLGLLLGSLNVWGGDPVSGSIVLGNASGAWDATATASFTDENDLEWSRTYSSNNKQSIQGGMCQFGNSSNPCTSLVLSTTIGSQVTLSAFSANFTGGASKTSGTIKLYSGTTELASATVSGTASVICEIPSSVSVDASDAIKVEYTGTNGSIKISGISYTYTSGGGGSPEPTVSVNPASWDFETVHASAAASKVFSVSGSNLESGSLTLTVPEGFSVSPSSIDVDGTLAATEVTVSKNTTEIKNYSGNLSISGGGLTSDKTVALTMTVDADPEPTGTFNKYTGATLPDGYYVICSGSTTTAMKNTALSGPRIAYATVDIVSNTITNPDKSVVWKLENLTGDDAGYFTLYNEKYAAFTSDNGKANVIADVTDYAKFALEENSSFDFLNKGKTGRYLRLNGTNGFANYASGTGETLTLYKKAVSSAVTIMNPSHGAVVVKNGDDDVVTAAEIAEGTILTVSIEDAAGYRFALKAYKTGDANTAVAIDEDGKLTMPGYPITITADELALFNIAVVVNDNTMGSATINGGTAAIYVDNDDEITLVATPASGHEFVNWTVSDANIVVTNANSTSTTALAGAAGTITANFQEQACSNLLVPAEGEITKTYNRATIAWNAVENAEGYVLNIKKHDDASPILTDEIIVAPKVSFEKTGLLANTQYDYTVMAIGDGATYCDENNPLLEGSFTTNDYPAATLTLHDANGSSDFDGSHKLFDVINLPLTAANCSKTFVGWDADENCTSAPTYAKGAEFTLSATSQDLYAVYADVTGGETSTTNIAYSGSTTNMDGTNQAATLVDATDVTGWSVVGEKGGNSNYPGLNTAGDIRLYYQSDNVGNTLTVTAPQTITSIALTFTGETYSNAWVKVNDAKVEIEDGVYPINNTTFVIGNANTSNVQVRISKIAVNFATAGTASNYSTTCAAAPVAIVNPEEVNASAAGVENGIIEVDYDNVDKENATVASNSAWLTVSLNDDKNIVYTIAENTSYKDAREATISLTAPETNGATDPAVVVIPVNQAKKEAVFASLADLATADVAANTNVTVTLTDVLIKEIYMYNNNRRGLVFDVQKDNEDVKIYFNADVPANWEAGGKVSGTLTDCPWKIYSGAWQLAPASGWAWNNLNYTEPAAVESIEIRGTATEKTYIAGQVFAHTGLKAFAIYGDSHEEDVTSLASWTYNPATLSEGDEEVTVTATYAEKSDSETVTGLTVNPIPNKTIAEFISAGGTRCYLEGTVSNITNTTYGNFDLTDASGSIYVYGCLTSASVSGQFGSLEVSAGDKIKVIAEEYLLYQKVGNPDKDEAVNVVFVSKVSPVQITIANKTLEVGQSWNIEATTDPEGAVNNISYDIKDDGSNAFVSLDGKKITANAVGTATIIASIPAGEGYLANEIEFEVEVVEAGTIADVVILAKYDGQWYALMNEVGSASSTLNALAVDYNEAEGVLLDVAEPSAITWTRSIAAGNATFLNGTKYIAGGTSNTNLTLSESASEWTIDEAGHYMKGDRTFLYNNAGYFKNYNASTNAGKAQYSDYPVVLANPQFLTRADIRGSLSEGKWGTICPKQEVKYPAGASFYQLTYMELNTDGSPYKFFFDEIAENASLEAGKPYLFIADGEVIKGVKVGGSVVDGDYAYNGFVGYIGEGKHISSDNDVYTKDVINYYGLQNNVFKLIYSTSSTNNILDERAYVEISPTRKPSTTALPMPAYSKRRLVVGAGAPAVTTGMDELNASETPVKVMIDGQLFIIRGEKMYNANGQLVK